jgi:hypothetical protein
MAHRLAAAVALARDGVPSTIADGRAAGLLAGFLAHGDAAGTRVGP